MCRYRLGLMLVIAFLLTQINAAADDVIGRVQFIQGDVWVYPAGSEQPTLVQKDHSLRRGDRLVTGSASRAMLKMVDQGLLSIHPDSSLTLLSYRYDAADPDANEIQLHLDSGSVRSITGLAGQANKESYRLTTPLVAIGIRGTDYVAYTNEDLSRAALISGAIAVRPLQDECGNTQSMCSQPIVLDESLNTLMVEYDRRHKTLQYVRLLPDMQARDTTIPASPPAPAQMLAQLRQGDFPPVTLNVPASRPAVDVEESVVAPVPSVFALASVDQPPQDVDSKRLVLSDLQKGRVWLDEAASISLPTQGQAALSLRDIQLSTPNGLAPAKGSEASLDFNFDKRSFDTRVTLTSESFPNEARLQSSGVIRGDGRFYSRSGDDVAGLIASEGQAAAYIFNLYKQGIPVTGMTSWQK